MLKKSFSLIEVLVFTAILALFFVAAMTISVVSLRSMKTQQYTIQATHLAEEATEWLNSEKLTDWPKFVAYDKSSGDGTIYCLQGLNWSMSGECPGFTAGSPALFKRELLLKAVGNPATRVDTEITVSWLDIGTIKKVTVKSGLRLLE
ncbi:hypothetical protein B6D29_04265 [Microgenomates bacterium UTCPR1]|nr:type II secretion system protein [Patescibacteria group bacterium]OQY65205.1 MAG: hypothetical protein B6D29_04265 [Microgenomates bacterium UTCPR1]